MHVDEDVVDLAELAQRPVDLAEGRVGGAHEEVPGDVHDAEPDAVALSSTQVPRPGWEWT